MAGNASWLPSATWLRLLQRLLLPTVWIISPGLWLLGLLRLLGILQSATAAAAAAAAHTTRLEQLCLGCYCQLRSSIHRYDALCRMLVFTCCVGGLLIYTASPKNIPDIFDCNLKNNYQILIIFGMGIPDTTCHQMTVQFPIAPNVCFCTTWGKQNQRNITFLSNAIWLLN